MKKTLLYFICFMVLFSCIFCIKSFATGEEGNNQVLEQEQPVENNTQVQIIEERCLAEVKSVGELKDNDENSNVKVQEVTLEIINGTYNKKEVTANYIITDKENAQNIQLKVGDEVNIIIVGDVQGNLFVTIQSLNRNTYIFIMIVVLIIAILLLYEKHAIKPLLSCLLTILLVYFLLFNQMINGHNVVLVSILFGIILSIVESIINTGFNKKIWICLLGTLGGVLVSIILSKIFISLARVNININSQLASNVNKSRLILAGSIIATIGSCINIAIHIIQNLDKKKNETKDFFRKDLFKLGIIYGGQQAIKYTSILIMVYVGLYLEPIIINTENYYSLLNSLNQDYIFSGMISIISSCSGIMISVILTSIFYSLINSKKTIYKTTSENKIDGKRSLRI